MKRQQQLPPKMRDEITIIDPMDAFKSDQTKLQLLRFFISNLNEAKPSHPIPLLWFERACELFLEFNLSPILFTAGGGGFLLDDGYVLADLGRDVVGPEGYVYVARRDDLIEAVRSRAIESLGLDAPRRVNGDREDWRGMVSVFSTSGRCYVGVDEDIIPDPSALLRREYRIAQGLFDIRYGIAYKTPLADYPDCYSSGAGGRFSLADFRSWL